MHSGSFHTLEETDRLRIYESFFGLFNLRFTKKYRRKNNILTEWILYKRKSINLLNKLNFDDIEKFNEWEL